MRAVVATIVAVVTTGCTFVDHPPPASSRANVGNFEHVGFRYDRSEGENDETFVEDIESMSLAVRRISTGVYAVVVATETVAPKELELSAGAKVSAMLGDGIDVLDVFRVGDYHYAFVRTSTLDEPWRNNRFLGRLSIENNQLRIETFDGSELELAAKTANVRSTRIADWGLGLRIVAKSEADTVRVLEALSKAKPDLTVWYRFAENEKQAKR